MNLKQMLDYCGYHVNPLEWIGKKFTFDLLGVDARDNYVFTGEPIGMNVLPQTVVGLITGIAQSGGVRLFVTVPIVQAFGGAGSLSPYELRLRYIFLEHTETGQSVVVFDEQRGREFLLGGRLTISP